MQDYFVNVIALLAFLMGVIPTVVVYRARVLELKLSRDYWREVCMETAKSRNYYAQLVQDIKSDKFKEADRG